MKLMPDGARLVQGLQRAALVSTHRSSSASAIRSGDIGHYHYCAGAIVSQRSGPRLHVFRGYLSLKAPEQARDAADFTQASS